MFDFFSKFFNFPFIFSSVFKRFGNIFLYSLLFISLAFNIKYHFNIDNLENQIHNYQKKILILKAQNSKLFVENEQLKDKIKNQNFECLNRLKKEQLLNNLQINSEEKIKIKFLNKTQSQKSLDIKNLPTGNYSITIP